MDNLPDNPAGFARAVDGKATELTLLRADLVVLRTILQRMEHMGRALLAEVRPGGQSP